MAPDAPLTVPSSARTLGAASRPLHRLLDTWKRFLYMPPLRVPAKPTKYSVALVTYWMGVIAAAAVLVASVAGPRFELGAVALLSTVAFVADYFSVSAVADIEVAWSTNIFVLLVAVLTVGPRGLVVVAIAGSIGHASRYRANWFRILFNAAMHTIEATLASMVFGLFKANLLVGGLAAGFTDMLANSFLLMGVVRIASGEIDLRMWIKDSAVFLLYMAVYGLGAAAAYILYPTQGMVAYAEVLGTPLALQAFLVLLARRVHLFNEETRKHQEARVRLLQRAIDASTTERERIAASIHDGVVQDLVGLTFSLGAYAGRDFDTLTKSEKAALMAQISEGAETTRKATHDLRTLMIEIASPKLKQAGLRAAVEDLLHNVSSNIETKLVMSPEIDSVSEAEQGLIYRVAQEGIRNATKYSRARNLSVHVTKAAGDIVLLVVDDGKGFDTGQRTRRQEQGHVGLTLLERTVKDGGGRLEISSQPGDGTKLTMSIPAS